VNEDELLLTPIGSAPKSMTLIILRDEEEEEEVEEEVLVAADTTVESPNIICLGQSLTLGIKQLHPIEMIRQVDR